ncbi:MAG: diguanylate cyclase (GGDEF)-like protein/PAS domain S-box-containing protein [Paraglaciecola sp.]|jgi:diguanylate cyclase (GGDEF)-like protein/PAS domain S-box-containing protein
MSKPKETDYRQLAIMQQAIFDGANYSIISTEIDGMIRSFNRGASKMLGYSPEEVIGKLSPAIFHKPSEVVKRAAILSKELGQEIQPGFDVFVEKARLGTIEELEWTYIRKDGREVPIMLSVTPLKNEQQQIDGFLGIAFDISETVRTKRALEEQEERYRLLYERSGDAIFLMNNGIFTDCNPMTLKIFGCTREQIINKTPYRFSPEFQPDGQSSEVKALQFISKATQGCPQSFEWTHCRYDDTPFDAEVTLNSIEFNGESHIFANVRDISQRKAVDQELALSRKRLLNQNESLILINNLSNQLNSSHSVQVIADKTKDALVGLIGTSLIAIYIKEPLSKTLKLMAASGFELTTLNLKEYETSFGGLNEIAIDLDDIQFSSDLRKENRMTPTIRKELLANKIYSAVSVPLSFEGSSFGCINLGYSVVSGYENIEKQTLVTIRNTVSQALANANQIKELDYMAHYDSLTGLSNRLLFHSTFEEKSSTAGYQSAALLLLDLDRFKEINDTLGHHMGDILLQKIGPRLKQAFAEHNVLISRLGGDEFTLLIDNVSDDGVINSYANTLLNFLRKPFDIDSIMLEIDASIGIAKYPQDGNDSHALLRSADVAMYEAKRNGGGIKVYDIEDDKHTIERLALIAEFNSAIRDNQLELHYQPKIDLTTGNTSGFEALVRWRHPTMGLLYPDKFIHLSEMSDSIHFMTESVIDMALLQQSLWFAKGYHLPVAVNLSARNLIDERCLLFIEKALQKYGTSEGMLELEITETSLMQDPETAVAILNKISKLGVQLSIDDFGTGYSSLAYLRRLPINSLKIDQEFVKDMLVSTKDAIIINSTVALAHSLSLEVVAEGVEDHKTLNRLKNMGCDLAQGYYICKPKPWPEIENWLAGTPVFFT